jgi:hypothetical protein
MMKFFIGGVNGKIEQQCWAKSKRSALIKFRKACELQERPLVTANEVTDKNEIIAWQQSLIESFESEIPDEYIGEVYVDSGQLIISDPGFLNEWKPGYFVDGTDEAFNSYDEVCKVTTGPGHGQVLGGFAVAFSSGYGDGMYGVYAKRDKDGRIVRVEIDMTITERVEENGGTVI